MEVKLIEGLLVVPQQRLGFRRVLAFCGHPLDQGDLLGDALLVRSDVLIGLGEVFAFFPGMGMVPIIRLIARVKARNVVYEFPIRAIME
jgi:hypothetical protein